MAALQAGNLITARVPEEVAAAPGAPLELPDEPRIAVPAAAPQIQGPRRPQLLLYADAILSRRQAQLASISHLSPPAPPCYEVQDPPGRNRLQHVPL